jgi:hypothetical protein
MDSITLHVKLVAKDIDLGNYITYVFENYNNTSTEDQYIMCVQFPNWNQTQIEIGDIGFVNVRYVKEGISEWYDGETMHKFKYTNVVFLKFIKESPQNQEEILID